MDFYYVNNPFDELFRMQRRINRMFDDTYGVWEPGCSTTSCRESEGCGSNDVKEKQKDSTDQNQQVEASDSTQPCRQVARPMRFWRPHVNITENSDQFEITAEVPGVNKDDVSVELHKNTLTISGEKKQEERKDGEKYHVVERQWGSFSRSLRLPEGVSENDLEASFSNGVLKVVVKKPPEPKHETKKIEIKS